MARAADPRGRSRCEAGRRPAAATTESESSPVPTTGRARSRAAARGVALGRLEGGFGCVDGVAIGEIRRRRDPVARRGRAQLLRVTLRAEERQGRRDAAHRASAGRTGPSPDPSRRRATAPSRRPGGRRAPSIGSGRIGGAGLILHLRRLDAAAGRPQVQGRGPLAVPRRERDRRRASARTAARRVTPGLGGEHVALGGAGVGARRQQRAQCAPLLVPRGVEFESAGPAAVHRHGAVSRRAGARGDRCGPPP